MAQLIQPCVVIPVYNNGTTIEKVINDCKKYISNLIVINDGSTDHTQEIINKSNVLSHHFTQNQGKGAALKKGFALARSQGYTHAITIDADAQHFPEDIPAFIKQIEAMPYDLIIGVRQENENMSGRSKFGRNLSNFLASLMTFHLFKDIQCGYRAYPLHAYSFTKAFVRRYDFEIETAIRFIWNGFSVSHIPVKVHYDEPEIRISHFRALRDNVRQSFGFLKLGALAFLRVPLMLILKLIPKGKMR